jgi:voltage-gated potassium channel
MIVTVLATIRFLRVLASAAWDPASRGIVALAGMTLLVGALFYRWAEGWSFVDGLYFSAVTLTTIGYGDLAPTGTGAKLFTVVYSFAGIGIIAAFVTTLAVAVREHPLPPLRRREPGDPEPS